MGLKKILQISPEMSPLTGHDVEFNAVIKTQFRKYDQKQFISVVAISFVHAAKSA